MPICRVCAANFDAPIPEPWIESEWPKRVGFCGDRCVQADLRAFVPAELLDRGFPPRFCGQELTDFEAATAGQARVAARLKGYVEKPVERGLFLTGEVGVGKTARATAVAGELALLGYSVAYETAHGYVAKCQNSFRENHDPAYVQQQFLKHRVVVVDDLGAERLTEFAAAEMDALFDALYRDPNRLPIVCSNLTLNQLGEVLPRAADRIAHMCDVLRIDGTTYRTKKMPAKRYELWYFADGHRWENSLVTVSALRKRWCHEASVARGSNHQPQTSFAFKQKQPDQE